MRIWTSHLFLFFFLAVAAHGQKAAKYGKVCGDPSVKCLGGDGFQPFDLPFNTGKNYIIAESEYFYGIVLKSRRVKDIGSCGKPLFGEVERKSIQELFPRNKVFTLNCWEAGSNYYSGVNGDTAFIGVFAGKTLPQAQVFLRQVKAANRFAGVKIRRMRVGINGT